MTSGATKPTGESFRENPIAFQNKIMATKGWAISQRIRPVAIAFYVFHQNYNEIRDALLSYEKHEFALEISRVGNQKKLDAFLREVIRRLHNYLASAMSLVDHTFVFVVDLYKGKPFQKEYHRERHRIFDLSPEHQFVQQLRNYALHQSIVDAMATTHFDQTGLDTSIRLDLEKLKAWTGWKGPAKKFVRDAPNDIRLLDLVESYTSAVSQFYDWISKRQQEIHKDDFDELKTLQDEYRKLVAGDLIGDQLE